MTTSTTPTDPTDATTTPLMPTADLGAGGPIVSRFALGAMTFGVETDEEEAGRQLDAFVAAGGTLVDTADVYGDGESERIIGRWIRRRGHHSDIVLATKGRFAPPAGSHGASRRSLVRSVDASLARLGVDALDLYLVHGWDAHTPVVETLDTLSTLVRAGRIHHLGWSNVTGWQLERLMATATAHDLVAPVAVQPQYNLLDRGIELEVLPVCLEHGLGVMPWSPLGGGWLTGKYRRDQRPTGASRLGEDPARGVEAYDLRNTARTWAVLDEVAAVAEAHDRPMSHVALAWLATRPGVASILLGARTLPQLADNLAAVDLSLTDDEVARLTRVSAPGLPPYPYGMVQDFCDVDVWHRLDTAAQRPGPS